MPKIGEGFGEWFEILLKIRRTKVVGIGCRVNPASGFVVITPMIERSI